MAPHPHSVASGEVEISGDSTENETVDFEALFKYKVRSAEAAR